MPQFNYDLFVIGAGSGGIRAARVAAAAGARVAVAEVSRVGGTCVIRGCVPKKMFVYGAQFAKDARYRERLGWIDATGSFDWQVLRDNVRAEVARLEGLYRDTLSTHNIDLFHGGARLVGPNSVDVAGSHLTAEKILIASGAKPTIPDVHGAEHGITSNEIFELETLPRSIVIIGGGYIAIEFAGILNSLGSDVTLLNRTDTILRSYDAELAAKLVDIYRARGIKLLFSTFLVGAERGADGRIAMELSNGDHLGADALLFAAGRSPNVTALGLDTVGVETGYNDAIKVDAENRTSVASIFAIGDVTDRIQLTPVAIREGQALADRCFNKRPAAVDYTNVPSAVFSDPPLASVGFSEAAAKAAGIEIDIYSSDFRPMKHALQGSSERAFYKMIVKRATGVVIGLHLLGPEAPEILQIAAVAMRAGATKQHFDDTMALHPTMAEELVLLK